MQQFSTGVQKVVSDYFQCRQHKLLRSLYPPVYQKGVIELKTDSDAIETTYVYISRKHDNGIVLDNGIMIFNASSSKGGELSFLNNTVAAYKDMIDLRRGILTTIAWEWK